MKKVAGTLAAALVLLLPAAAGAQEQVRRFKVEENGIRVGFQKFAGSNTDGFKAGMWTPLVVTFVEDEQGSLRLPTQKDGSVKGEILVETADNDNVLNVYPQEFSFPPGPGDALQIVTYAKVASTNPQLKVTVKVRDQTFQLPSPGYFQAVDLGQHVYLALGDNLPELRKGLLTMVGMQQKQPNQQNQEVKETGPRHAFYENTAKTLPEMWFGYDSVDVVVLVTSNGAFVDELIADRQSSPQLAALAEWVRRGGRLVLSIAPTRIEKVHRLLSSPAWRPALPPVLTPESTTFQLEMLNELCTWSGALKEPFRPQFDKEGEPVARLGIRLRPLATVGVACQESDGKSFAPLIVRFPHGMGSITLLAFDVKDGFFSEWAGQPLFWRAVVEKLGPVSRRDGGAQFGGMQGQKFGGPGQGFVVGPGSDVTSQLYATLEEFDTPSINYGWVALFILLYIIVVGPLDYLLLKVVFKRLEWTWLTFPAVVITVSLLAYFTAYAIKGQDLKVNKVDLIDIDMRTSLGDDFQPAGATAYGTSWFTIFSPRIQNYTIGLEPVMHTWQGLPAPAAPVEPTMSWLGRPEPAGMGAIGRGRSPGLFNRTYKYQANAIGLVGVPIPVWTMKSFTASWAAQLDKAKLPFESKLTYMVGQRGSLSGTLKSNLPFELLEVCLIMGDKFYPLADIPQGGEVKLFLDPLAERPLSTWVQSGQFNQKPLGPDDIQDRAARFRPKQVLRNLMFHEKVDSNQDVRNHTFRSLDWSWRCDQSWRLNPEGDDGQVKEIILVAYLGRVKGLLEKLEGDNDPRLPTHLWLGELPGQTKKTAGQGGKTEDVLVPRPAMEGTVTQETFLRVIFPVTPQR